MNFSIKYHLLLKLQYFTYWDFLQDKNQFCLTNYKNNIKTINWLNKRKATRGFWETENLFSCFPTFTTFFPKCHSQIQFSISITRIAIHKMYIYKIILSTINSLLKDNKSKILLLIINPGHLSPEIIFQIIFDRYFIYRKSYKFSLILWV